MTDFVRQQRRRKLWQWMQIVFIVLLSPILLLVLAVAVHHGRAEGNLSKKLAAIRAAGLPATPEELNAYTAMRPGETDIAPQLKTLATALPSFVMPPEVANESIVMYLEAIDGPLPANVQQAIGDYVSTNAKTIDAVVRLTDVPSPRCRMDALDFMSQNTLSFRDTVHIGRGILLDVATRVGDDRSGEACRDILALLKLARAFRAELVWSGNYNSHAAVRCAASAAELAVRWMPFTDGELASLGSAFESTEDPAATQRFVIGRRACLANMYRLCADHELMAKMVGSPGKATPTEVRMKTMLHDLLYIRTGLLTLQYTSSLEMMDELATIASGPLWQQPAEAQAVESRWEARWTRYDWLPREFVDGVPSVAPSIAIETEATLRVARTALAAKRYRLATGTYPDSLNQLVPKYLAAVPIDPFSPTEATLRYARRDRTAVVYSVGGNQVDDGGQRPRLVTTTVPVGPSLMGPSMPPLTTTSASAFGTMPTSVPTTQSTSVTPSGDITFTLE